MHPSPGIPEWSRRRPGRPGCNCNSGLGNRKGKAGASYCQLPFRVLYNSIVPQFQKITVFLKFAGAASGPLGLASEEKIWHNTIRSHYMGACCAHFAPGEHTMQRYRSGHNGADSKSCFHFGSPNCRKASNHAGLRASSNRELGSVLSCCSSQFPRLEFCGKMAIMRAAI